MVLAPVAMVGAFIRGFAEISNLSLIPNVALAAGLSPEEALWFLSTMRQPAVWRCSFRSAGFPTKFLVDSPVTIALAIAFIVLALALPAALTMPLAAIIVAFLLGGVILGFDTVGLAIVGERVGANDLDAANAAFLVMYQAGATTGPLVAGIAMTASPVTGFVVMVATLMAVSWIVLMVFEGAGRRRTQA